MIALIGSGYMAEEHLRVLKELRQDVIVVGRDEEKAKKLAEKYGYEGRGGGAERLEGDYSTAIIASSVQSLSQVTCELLKKGIKHILVEKPGAPDLKQLKQIQKQAGTDSYVRIAHNRRYYNSILHLRSILENEKLKGIFFDFTEREKDIKESGHTKEVMARWGFNNSTHVIDTAFFLAGMPKEIICEQSGGMDEHKSGTEFAGHGRTSRCIFSYYASWGSGGRWKIEASTSKGRYILCPIEELKLMPKDQFKVQDIELQDDDDQRFKPGVYKMVKAFLEKKADVLPTIDQEIMLCNTVDKICGYNSEV